jgi:hypothetical protein
VQTNWHMNVMIFKISLTQFNGTINTNNKNIFVPGNELENFVITSITNKSKYIFDYIGPMSLNFDIRNKMIEASYSQRSNNDLESSFDPPGSYNFLKYKFYSLIEIASMNHRTAQMISSEQLLLNCNEYL